MNQKIRFLRELLNLTETEVSTLLNISSYKYISYEKNDTSIPFDVLLLISKIYGITIERLLNISCNKQELLFELNNHGFINLNDKEKTLKKIKLNLFSNEHIKVNYHSIRKVKNTFQCNIINSIKSLCNEKNYDDLQTFALSCELDLYSLKSIVSGKKFIGLFEILKISEHTKIPIDNIINGI